MVDPRLSLLQKLGKTLAISTDVIVSIPPTYALGSTDQAFVKWDLIYDAHNEVTCLMLKSMTPELHRQFENSSPYDMLQELRSMFEKQARVERFDLIRTFHACKQDEGKSVSSYVLKMKGYVEQLKHLGYVLLNTIYELHALLIEYKKRLPKKAGTPQVLAIQGSRIQSSNKKSQNAKKKGKGKGNGKDKLVYTPKPKNPKPSTKEHPTKDDACHHCKEVGHWKSNYHVYLDELMKKKKHTESASTSVSKNNVLYFNAIPRDGIYEIDMLNLVPNVNSISNVSNKRAKLNLDSTYLWHCHLAHISKKRIEKLQHDGLLKSTHSESFDECVSCLFGKMTMKPFSHRTERVTDLLRLIHMNDCVPVRHVSRQCASYFITFMDDFSHYGYVYLLKHKHEVFEIFKVFKNEVKSQPGKTIKALRSYRGGEYISQEFKDYLKACGIVQQRTTPYTPQHNGVSKRRNRTLLDMVRSMMNLTTMPLSFWDYALESAIRILNMVLTKKVWGCETLVKRDTLDKLQKISVKCIFVGFPKETMGYYFYFPLENKIVVASKIHAEVEGFELPQEKIAPMHRSVRTHRGSDRLCLNVKVEDHSLRDLNEPANYQAALLDPESNKWLDAMNAEMQSMKDNQVCRLVDLPPNGKTVRSKWLFKKKTDMDGNVHTYKARLVAKSYTQTYRIDYEEMFSPVADIKAIRILIAIAMFYDYEIWKMDVKISF
ncbi:retrotransposon protein, putative, ty1-copia subclass [Tanacetum coccineum]